MNDSLFYSLLLLFAVVYLALLTLDWTTRPRPHGIDNQFEEARKRRIDAAIEAACFPKPRGPHGFSAQNERRRRKDFGAQGNEGLSDRFQSSASKGRVQ